MCPFKKSQDSKEKESSKERQIKKIKVVWAAVESSRVCLAARGRTEKRGLSRRDKGKAQ